MQLAVLQYCCLLLAIMLFAVRTPGSSFYHPLGVVPQISGPPVASQPAAICSVYCHMLYMQPLCSQMQPTGSQMHPRGCPISARMLPCGQPNNTICNVFCNMLHMRPSAAKCSPQATKSTPQAPNISPALWPTSQQLRRHQTAPEMQ